MARATVNIGSAPNDGTGDTIRAGGTKVNDNFAELYAFLGGDTLPATIPDSIIPAGIARDTEVTAAVAAHEAAGDPHPQYLTAAEGDALFLTPAEGDALFLTPAEGDAAYAALVHATRHQNGGADEISVTGLSGLLADAQTPLAHAVSHKSGGADPIKLDELAAPTDVTTLDATTLAHGLMQKYPGGTTTFLRADGTFASPGAGSTDIKAAAITAPYNSFDYTETVTDATVAPTNQIIVNWGAVTDDDENTPDMEDVNFMAVAGTGNFTVKISSPNNNPFGGPFKLNYLIG